MKNIQIKFFLPFLLVLISYGVSAQGHLVRGTIVDASGNPLPGVTVIEKASTNGVVSNIDGKYSIIAAQPSAELVFSYLGFETKNVPINNLSIIDVMLQENVEDLEEVQVVAFQKQKKNSVIGSINTINVAELKQPNTNLTASLAGRMAGIISYQRSGEPGQDNAEFFIRGVTTFGYKNNPLILIDGLEVGTDDLARVETDNIASFSIMKDATATALYGSRGANGVILITTKEGVKGKAKVSVRVENTFSAPTQTNEFLDGVSSLCLGRYAVFGLLPFRPRWRWRFWLSHYC